MLQFGYLRKAARGVLQKQCYLCFTAWQSHTQWSTCCKQCDQPHLPWSWQCIHPGSGAQCENHLQIGNIRVEYGTGFSAVNVFGNSSICSSTFHGAASNNTKEAISPSICNEFTSSALPSDNHLSIYDLIFTYCEGPSVVTIFQQLHYTIYFRINSISTFHTGTIDVLWVMYRSTFSQKNQSWFTLPSVTAL